MTEYSSEAFDDVTGREVDVGEQVGQEFASVLGTLANDVDTLGRENSERQRVGNVSARLGSLTVDEHSFGGISRAACQGQIDLDAPFALEEHPVNLARALATSNEVARRARSKRRRRGEGVDGFEDRRLTGSVGRQKDGDRFGVDQAH